MEYFSTNGITSTSAQHYCNIAAELIKSLGSEIAHISFFNENVEVLTNGTSQNTYEVKKGYSNLSRIKDILLEQGDITTLIAYLKEAIKEKENRLAMVKSKLLNVWLKENNMEEPVRPLCSGKDYEMLAIDELPDEERLRYFMLEAQAATIGKAIHKNGAVSSAIDELNSHEKIELTEIANELVKKVYTPCNNKDDVDKMFLDLQRAYRDLNSSLNAIKAKVKVRAYEMAMQDSSKYQKDLENYRVITNKLQSQFDSWAIAESSKIANLKIAIPSGLKAVYDFVSNA